MIGDILLMAISVISSMKAYKGSKHLANAKSQIKWQKVILIVLLVVAIVITIVYFTSKTKSAKEAYNNIMADGYSELNRHNYANASFAFSKAILSAYDTKTKIEATYWEATCDYLDALYNNNDVNRYSMAETKYRAIIYAPNAKSSEYYVDAIVGLCRIFYELGFPSDDIEYKGYIEWLQENVDLTATAKLAHGMIAQKLSVAILLAEYYEYCATEHLQSILQGRDARKAIDYYLIAFDLYSADPIASANRVGPQIDIICLVDLIDNILNASFTVDATYFADSIIRAKEMCQKLLDSAFELSLSLEDILIIKKDIAKADWLCATIYHDKSYLDEAYSILQPILRTAYENGYVEIGYRIVYWIVRTNLCTVDDSETIIPILIQNYNYTKEYKNTDQIIRILLGQCSTCVYIAQNYDWETDMLNVGADCIRTLSSYQIQMNEEELTSYHELVDYFIAGSNTSYNA